MPHPDHLDPMEGDRAEGPAPDPATSSGGFQPLLRPLGDPPRSNWAIDANT